MFGGIMLRRIGRHLNCVMQGKSKCIELVWTIDLNEIVICEFQRKSYFSKKHVDSTQAI